MYPIQDALGYKEKLVDGGKIIAKTDPIWVEISKSMNYSPTSLYPMFLSNRFGILVELLGKKEKVSYLEDTFDRKLYEQCRV